MFKNAKTEKVQEVGEAIVDGAQTHERASVREKWSDVATAAEDFDDDSALYTTLQADMIEEALEPELLGLDALNTVEFQLNQGVDSIQVPQGQKLSATEINADGSLAADDTQYSPTSVDIKWVGVRTTFSGQIVDKAKVDLLAFRMEQAGRAIARKVDADILTAIETATPADGSNGNYTALGTDATLGYDDVVETVAAGAENDARLDMMVAHPTTWANFMTDADTKQGSAFGTSTEGETPMVERLGPVRIYMTSQVSADTALFVDTDRASVFVDASEVQTFDGRVNENYQFEILAVKAYGVSIVNEDTVYRVQENTA